MFFDLRHQTIYDAMLAAAANGGLDEVTLNTHLHDRRQLEGVGGHSYLNEIQDKTPSAGMLTEYLDIVWQKFKLRRTAKICQEIEERVYTFTDLDDFQESVQADLAEIQNFDRQSSEQIWSVKALNHFDIDNDPNAVIGHHDGRTTRYLCRGYGAWLIGPSGVGKSSFIHQCAFSWALGRPFLGITPIRRLRVLIIQAENDEGDEAEMTQGILRSLGISELDADLEVLNDSVKLVTERRTTGGEFCLWLEKHVIQHRADIVFADPFLSFAGIDVARQEQCTAFLRHQLNPVLVATGAILFASHHTGKPKTDKQRQLSAIEEAYQGIGSSELVNWARAIMVLKELGDDQHYRLKLAKRGSRAWALDTNGEKSIELFLRHARDRIFWEQVAPPEESKEVPGRGGKPSVAKEIACSNLHSFLVKCTEGEGLNEISKRLESWLAGQKRDVSRATCKRIIPLLVENGKISKNSEALYMKGPNA